MDAPFNGTAMIGLLGSLYSTLLVTTQMTEPQPVCACTCLFGDMLTIQKKNDLI